MTRRRSRARTGRQDLQRPFGGEFQVASSHAAHRLALVRDGIVPDVFGGIEAALEVGPSPLSARRSVAQRTTCQ